MCTWGGNVQVLCITRVTCESHAPSHSHAIWTKLRVGGAFGFGWHYLESKYNFDRLFLFPNSTLFQTQILFQWNTTLAGISRYQLVPKQALTLWCIVFHSQVLCLLYRAIWIWVQDSCALLQDHTLAAQYPCQEGRPGEEEKGLERLGAPCMDAVTLFNIHWHKLLRGLLTVHGHAWQWVIWVWQIATRGLMLACTIPTTISSRMTLYPLYGPQKWNEMTPQGWDRMVNVWAKVCGWFVACSAFSD